MEQGDRREARATLSKNVEFPMSRKRDHIPLSEKLASALADKLSPEQRKDLRERKVSAATVIRLFTPDHNILHTHGGEDLWWNLTMRQRGPELKAKDIADTKIAAKVKRIRGETCTGPKKKIPSRPFQKVSRPFERRA